MTRSSIQLIAFLAGCVVLFIIARGLIAAHAVPSLSDFIASSTAASENASTTPAEASTTTADVSDGATVATSTVIRAPKGTISAEISGTEASRDQGLSDRTSLGADSGMLFVFDQPGEYGFWMKDMHFPLDMVWIAADKSVVAVTRGIAPDTYPEIVDPPSPVLYVLEINAGAAKRFGIATGTILEF